MAASERSERAVGGASDGIGGTRASVASEGTSCSGGLVGCLWWGIGGNRGHPSERSERGNLLPGWVGWLLVVGHRRESGAPERA